MRLATRNTIVIAVAVLSLGAALAEDWPSSDQLTSSPGWITVGNLIMKDGYGRDPLRHWVLLEGGQVLTGSAVEGLEVALDEFRTDPLHPVPLDLTQYKVRLEETTDTIFISFSPLKAIAEDDWGFGAPPGTLPVAYRIRKEDGAVLQKAYAE